MSFPYWGWRIGKTYGFFDGYSRKSVFIANDVIDRIARPNQPDVSYLCTVNADSILDDNVNPIFAAHVSADGLRD